MHTTREKLRVLLVEDNPGDVDLVRCYLADDLGASIDLATATSLSNARDAIEEGEPDLVLLDLGLPDGTGVEVVSEMRRMLADVPIVVLTGLDDPDSGIDALKSDAQDYLVKDTLSGSMLRRSIRYAVERHRWQQQYRHQLGINPDGIIILGSDGEVLFSNPAASVMLGRPPVDVDDLPDPIRALNGEPADVALATGRTVEARSVDTEWQGRRACLVALRDITDRRQAEEALSTLTEELKRTNARLEELVSTDPLTGVLNRRGVEEILALELDRMRRTGNSLAAVLVDCDDFKGINDTHGHAVGDAALKALTKSVAGALRAGDHLARVGGDEFLVLLSETSIAEAMSVAEKLRQAIKATTLPVADGSFQLSGSFAVGGITPDIVSIEQVLATLNAALKRSKRSGKDRVSAQGPDGESWSSGLPGPGTELDAEQIELGVALQPIRRISDEAVVGYEALTRGPPGFYAMPDDLFRAAYELNVLTTLDLRALTSALDRLGGTDLAGIYHINVFPSTLLAAPVAELVDLIERSGAAGRVCLELSEQRFLGDPLYLREPVLGLREAGVRVGIDDVGFGRSSVEALLVLEPDHVKVDRRCINAITETPGDRRQLERLLAMLSAVGAEVIAEGVERREELEVLRDLGVALAQGYVWDRPMTGERAATGEAAQRAQ